MSSIGRHDPAAVYIGSDASRVDWISALPTVSGVHCRLFYSAERGGWLIEDLGSSNGTILNGQRLAPGAAVPITSGDRVHLGRGASFAFDAVLVQKLTAPANFAAPQALPVIAENAVPRTTGGDPQSAAEGAPGTRHLTRGEMDSLIAGAAVAGGAHPHGGAEPPHAHRPQEAAPPSEEAVSISLGYSDINDVAVPNSVVSGRHARIYSDRGAFLIEDQGSTNGTWIHGHRVRRASIRPGDGFALGSYRMVFDDALVARLAAKRSEAQSPAPARSARALRVGRDPANDIVIEAPMVSAWHATLVQQPAGGWLLRDEGSTNGTWLNSRDNRVSTASVDISDVIYFGSYRFPMARVAGFLGDAGVAGDEIALPTGKPTIVIGRDAEVVDIAIDRPQISRRHAEIRLLGDGRFEVRDLGSANGTFINGNRISGTAVVSVTDRVSLGSWQIRLDPARGVLRKDYHGDIMIQAERVSIDVPDPKAPGGRKRILNDVSFTAYPTEFVGLMGPSGAGKTTLMMALNGYTPPTTGRSLINGTDLYENYNSFRGNIGYVPQDDIVFPQLTVYESLFYTARLRLPADTTDAEIDAKISRVLDELEIQQTRDVLIGDAVKKGISGGQRKRVNLAQELITEPSLLFLDEPTSGLASEDTINVMRLLRGLANGGKTILLTIHQPSLEAYRMMDNVIYLFQGSLAYYGPAYPDSLLFFNPDAPAEGAERERLLADPANAMKPLAQEQRRAFDAPSPTERQQRLGTIVETRRQSYVNSRQYKEFVYDRAGASGRAEVALNTGNKQKTERRGMWRQWGILTSRTARIKWKDRVNSAILLVQAPVIAIVLALVYLGKVGAGQYFDNLMRGPSALFLLVSSAVWFGCSNSAREIVSEQAIYRRERMVNLMIPSYVLSKFVVLGAVCAIQCAILLGIVHLALHLEGSFALMYGVMLLVSWAGLGMGLTLSSMVRSGEASVALVPLLLIPQIILGGVIMPIHEMNTAMKALSSTMVARWGYEALLHIEYGDDSLTRMQSECGIPDCVWGVGPTGLTYYAGDPTQTTTSGQFANVQSLQGGQVPPVRPSNDADICQAFCVQVQNGQEITPIDRSFGAHPADAVRIEARDEISQGGAADRYTSPRRDSRSDFATDLGVLAAVNALLLALVMSILRFRDVEVG